MPPTHYDAIRGGFTTSKSKPSIAGQASSRAAFLRERWGIIKEIILRNENFTPPAIGGHDRSSYLKLTSTRNLLGRAGQLFLLFGMLSRNPEGKLCLEDGEGRVVLDMEDAVSRPRRGVGGAEKGDRVDEARSTLILRPVGTGRRNVYGGMYGPDRGRVHGRRDHTCFGNGSPAQRET